MLWRYYVSAVFVYCIKMEQTVTHIMSLLTEVAVVVVAAAAEVGSASGFASASGSGCGGRGCLGLENGGSTSRM